MSPKRVVKPVAIATLPGPFSFKVPSILNLCDSAAGSGFFACLFTALENFGFDIEFWFVASETGSHFVAQACLELITIPLSQPSECWDCRHKPPHLKGDGGNEWKAMEVVLTGGHRDHFLLN